MLASGSGWIAGHSGHCPGHSVFVRDHPSRTNRTHTYKGVSVSGGLADPISGAYILELRISHFDYHSVDGIDDADDDALFVLIQCDGEYGWHWIARDTFAENEREDLARYGL
jgi:hypothetical protein